MPIKQLAGLTCCVGPVYASYLERTLPLWMNIPTMSDGLDRLVIVTKPGDDPTIKVYHRFLQQKPRMIGRVILLETDAFTLHGGTFNKGAALNIAYNVLNPIDWVLHFDADIEPPVGFRYTMESVLVSGNLYGAKRYSIRHRPLDEHPIYPYGYFHCWNVADPVVQFWPLFCPFYGHAGHYDAEFADRWPRANRLDCNLYLIHHGEPRHNWFGTDKSMSTNARDNTSMQEIHRIGLRRARDLRTGMIQHPDYKLKIRLLSDNIDSVRDCITALRSHHSAICNPWSISTYWANYPPPLTISNGNYMDVYCANVTETIRTLTQLLEARSRLDLTVGSHHVKEAIQ